MHHCMLKIPKSNSLLCPITHNSYNQTLASTPLFEHTKILHTLVKMGSAALAAAVEGKVTQISCKGLMNHKKKFFLKAQAKTDSNSNAAKTTY